MMPVIYRRIRGFERSRRVPAVFLDRDGVLVEEVGHLHRVADIHYVEGALAALAGLKAAALPLVLVTNQAGIGRGLYRWDDFERVQAQIDRDVAAYGVRFDGVWACAAHPDGVGTYAHTSHPFRKPNPGMIFDAAEFMHLDVNRSWLIGDQPSDIEAGLRAGVAGVCHVNTGHGRATRTQVEHLRERYPRQGEFLLCASLADAIPHVLAQIETEAACLPGKF